MNVNSTSSVSSNNGFSGMISGMDTDSLVEKLLSATQTKIDKQKGLKTQTEWKIENYRDVITTINSFSSKYFNTSYGASSKNNLASAAFFNTMTSRVTGGSAVKVISSAAGASTEDMNIIVIEDIIDSGRTLSYLMDILKARNPKSIKLCTLLDKPDRRVVDIDVDYTGFEIPDEFVVGFGLDYAQKYRNLPYVGVVEL